jgi:hypothetical protein
VSMASASSVPYPSSKESTNASFEGSSSTCSAPAGFEGAPEGSPWFEGVSLGVDGRFRDIPRKDVRGNGDSPQRDLGEFIHLLVVSAGNVIELDAVELVLEGSHGIAVGLHLIVVTAHILHDLVNHELRFPLTSRRLMPVSMAIRRPQRRASYSTMLLDAGWLMDDRSSVTSD